MTRSTFAGLAISPELADQIKLLPAAERVRLEAKVRQRTRRYIGGRALSAILEDQLFAQDTPGFRYFRALMRLDRRAR